MGTMVQYRDLPGGPIMIKFADEISRHCLCQNCRMFSMSMYSDPASHLFCDSCISEQSYKHNKFEIYCPDERKPVPFEQLFEALDVVTILRDQHVQCPNQPKCAMILPLEQLENHYIQCKELTSVNCTKCRREVAATSWNKHKSECQPTCDSLCAPKESQDRYNLQFSAVSPRGTPASTPKKTGAAKGARPESTNIYPTNELQQIAQGGTTGREERATSLPPYPSDKPDNSRSCDPHTVPCTFCGRQVKTDNMQRHVQACYARPTACPSCYQVIKATDMNAHITRCQQEPEERIKKRQQQQNTTNEKKKSEAASKGRGRNLPSPSSNAHAASQGEASMGVDVQYRDLPGGTRRLRFADELPRRLMCGTCGMLSMHMLEDKQGHAFCNVCVGQKSQATAIFCEYEKKNVSLDELVESFDINQIIKDQVVFCPNEQRGCRAYTPLSDIEDHYLQCEKTEIECAQCQQRIRGCHWKTHLKNCPRKIVQCRYCVTAFPQIDLQTHEALCTANPNRITSTTAHLSSLSNSSAFPVSAEVGARSEYASPDMTSPTRDPVKIRHQGWPWWFLPVVICFTCLTFFPRTVVNVFLKPLLDTVFRILRLAHTALLGLYQALLSTVGPRRNHSVTRDSYRAVQHRSFY